jgi:glycosyltransferase involved in cell wall biosynthesis
MKPQPPEVSVCIPFYNAAKTIGATVASVLSQQGCRWELILQDNCSTDDSVQIVNEVISTHAAGNVTLRRLAHPVSREDNWKLCIESSSAEWVKLLFADDLLYADCLKLQLDLTRNNRGIVLVTGRRDIIMNSDRPIFRGRGHGTLSGRFTQADLMREVVRTTTNPIGEPEAVLFKRSAASLVGGFCANNPYVVDLDYWVRLLSHGDGFAHPSTVGAFRVHPGSVSVRLVWQQPRMMLKFLADAQAAGLVRLSHLDWARQYGAAMGWAILRGAVYCFGIASLWSTGGGNRSMRSEKKRRKHFGK